MPEDLPDRMSDRMSEDMPDRVPGDMPEHIAEDMPGRMPEDMPDRMPEDMPDKMPEDMSNRMPEDSPVTKRIDVMVGITRSKVFFFLGQTIKHENMLVLCVSQVTMSCFTEFHRLDHGLDPLIWQPMPMSIQEVCRALLAQPPAFQYQSLSLQVHVRKRVLAARRVRARLLENLCSAESSGQ